MAFVYLGQSSGNIVRAIETWPLIGKPLARWLKAKAARTHARDEGAGEKTEKPLTLGAALVMFLLSQWRAHKFARMLALSRRGRLVIADRYPQAEVPGFYFDGTGLDLKRAQGWLVRALARREQRLYRQMASHVPALVIRLNVDEKTAHARKPDHKPAMLRQKLAVIPHLQFNGAKIADLDSREPYAQMLDAALQAVRQSLESPATKGANNDPD